MRKYKKRDGICKNLDLSMVIGDILQLPIDKVQHYPIQAANILQAILDSISAALHRGEDVHVKGFGIFRVKQLKPRTYTNIVTTKPPGEDTISQATRTPIPIVLPGKKRVFFYPAIQLKAMLNHETPSAHERRAISIWNK
jgi:nucleoid DNA-binding protein